MPRYPAKTKMKMIARKHRSAPYKYQFADLRFNYLST
jgi:hypothetical protein